MCPQDTEQEAIKQLVQKDVEMMIPSQQLAVEESANLSETFMRSIDLEPQPYAMQNQQPQNHYIVK